MRRIVAVDQAKVEPRNRSKLAFDLGLLYILCFVEAHCAGLRGESNDALIHPHPPHIVPEHRGLSRLGRRFLKCLDCEQKSESAYCVENPNGVNAGSCRPVISSGKMESSTSRSSICSSRPIFPCRGMLVRLLHWVNLPLVGGGRGWWHSSNIKW